MWFQNWLNKTSTFFRIFCSFSRTTSLCTTTPIFFKIWYHMITKIKMLKGLQNLKLDLMSETDFCNGYYHRLIMLHWRKLLNAIEFLQFLSDFKWLVYIMWFVFRFLFYITFLLVLTYQVAFLDLNAIFTDLGQGNTVLLYLVLGSIQKKEHCYILAYVIL